MSGWKRKNIFLQRYSFFLRFLLSCVLFPLFFVSSPSGRTTKRETSLKRKPLQSFEPTKATAKDRQRATIRTNQTATRNQSTHGRWQTPPTNRGNVTTFTPSGATAGRRQDARSPTKGTHNTRTFSPHQDTRTTAGSYERHTQTTGGRSTRATIRTSPTDTTRHTIGRQATKQAPTMADPTTHDTRTTHDRRERFTRPFYRRHEKRPRTKGTQTTGDDPNDGNVNDHSFRAYGRVEMERAVI